MEQELATYIKNMFSTQRPEWTPDYEGVMIFDIDAQVWVVADDVGWIELEEEI